MVHFVGAGSGAKDLITVRGAKLIQEADVLIYAGSLINPELLELKSPDCKLYNSAYMTLEQVIDVIKEAEKAHLTTVRLHTGDPSIYGAVREQFDALDALSIGYDVCPGVSSFCGAAAALKAELTLPGVSQTVILTRAEGRTKVPERESIKSLASHRATMVFFLSASLALNVQNELLAGGYPKDTQSAIVYKATWSDEAIYRCPLSELSATMDRHLIKKTALIIVGDALGDEYLRSMLYHPQFETEFRKATE